MTDKEKLERFLSEQKHMILAVVLDDGTPWAVPVRIQQRRERVFEWDSKLDTIHSKALTERAGTAITIFDKSSDSQIGFYAKGKAKLIEEYKPGYGRYSFVAMHCWMNDETFVKREVEL